MLPLNRHLAASYMSSHPLRAVVVDGGGTAVGARALIEGRADLCAASRALGPEEVEELYRAAGTLGVRYLVALDAVAIYLHPDNPVHDLGLDELAGLFTGAVTNWSAVGGATLPVRPVIRPPTSGTHRFVRDHVLKGRPYLAGALVVPRTRDVVDTVASDPAAVGYGGLSYGGEVRHSAVDGVVPDASSIRNGAYPLARYLYFYTSAPPEGAVLAFVEWVVGPEGQAAVAETDLLALWATP
jgi:phosphate transport system substrate-binding protein